MSRLLKALPLALAIVALIVLAAFAASCGSSSAQARFVNAISNATAALDIDFNGTKIFSQVAFPDFSASTYTSVPSGTDAIEGLGAGSNNQAFPPINVSLNSGSSYTLVAAGLLANDVTILNPVDNNTAPANGTINFRVIDASSSTGSVDVYIIPNPVTKPISSYPTTFSNLASLSTSGYANQSFNSTGPGFSFFVTTHGNTIPLFTGVTLNGGSSSVGTVCTLVLTDTSDGNHMSSAPLPLEDLNNCTIAIN